MPTWLLSVLLAAGKWLWHSLLRFWSVFLVGAVILSVGLWITGYKLKTYTDGYQAGYTQAIKDHPQTIIQSGGKVTNITNSGGFKWLGVDFQVFKVHLKLGV